MKVTYSIVFMNRNICMKKNSDFTSNLVLFNNVPETSVSISRDKELGWRCSD